MRFLWTLLLVVALPGCAADSDPAPATTDTVLDATSASDTTAESDTAGTPPAPNIAEIGCSIADPPVMSVTPGADLSRATLAAPLAVCNDGSPAVIYVKPGTGDGSSRWIVWLDAGGGCTSVAGCSDRWCGRSVPNTAAKMSSRWAPEAIEGTGIFDPTPTLGVNDFANWNQVQIYYCSSDSWAGQVHHARLVHESGERQDYSIYFHGAYIVDATFELLKAGVASDDGTRTLPSIDEASLVLLSGSSAGSGGVRVHADAVGESLRQTNADVDFRAVLDAAIWTKAPGPSLPAEAAESYVAQLYEVSRTFRNARVDASCLDFHAEPSPCADTTHVLVHHLATPYFAKMDITDVGDPGIYPTPADYVTAQEALLRGLMDDTIALEEAAAQHATGLYSPRCGHHIALRESEFYEIRMGTSAANAVSFHDVLMNWVDGLNPRKVLDDPPTVTSSCP